MRLWKGKPVRKLLKRKKLTGGRNNQGRTTVLHRGYNTQFLHRHIDFKRSLWDIKGYVKRLEYDPNRSGYIALIMYTNGILSYILAPDQLEYDSIINAGLNASLDIGNAKPLFSVPLGIKLYNLELIKGKGASLCRAAGNSSQILKKNDKIEKAIIKIKKGYELQLNNKVLGTLGCVSNLNHKFYKMKNAGHARKLGKRPNVRGVAMNPVDHPHGGGEGKTSGGRCSVSKWGWLTKGYKTKKKNV